MPITAPTDIAGLLRWGKADAEAYGNGASVSTYHDQSGNARDFIAAGTAQPTFVTAVQNGLPMLQWNGTSNFMTFDALSANLSGTNVPFSFFWCGKHSALALVHQCFFICSNATGSATPTQDLFWRGETFNWWADRRDNAANIRRVQGFTPDLNCHTLIYTYDGTTGSLYADGLLAASYNESAVGLMTCTAFTYGSHRRSDGNDSFFNGYWGEDGIYSVALTGTNVTDLHNYLRTKWNSATPGLPWDPNQIGASLQSWHREDSWGFLADGAATTTWFSKAGHSTTEPDGIGTGTYKVNVVNGKAAALMNGTSDLWASNLMAPNMSGTAVPFTAFGAFKCTDLTNAQEIFGAGISTGSIALHRLQIPALGAAYHLDRRNDANVITSLTGGVPDLNTHTFVYVYDGTLATLYVNGTIIMGPATLGTGAITCDKWTWGGFARNTIAEWFKGYIAEVGFVTAAVSGANLTNLLSYLAARWIPAPVITIGSLSLAANGLTLTGTLAGGTGTGYGPASAVTGITVNVSGSPVAVTSNSISGSTLTLNLTSVVGVGLVVTVTIIAGSNLVDSGANTAGGQVGVAVTNNSAVPITTFKLAASSAILSGLWGAETLLGGHLSRVVLGQSSQIDGTFTGTQLEVYIFANTAADYAVSIDGAAFTVAVLTTAVWGFQTFATGLTDAVHTYSIRGNGSGKVPYIDSSTSGTFRVTGAVPACGAPDATLFSSNQYVISANTANLLLEGGWASGNFGGYPTVYSFNGVAHSWQDVAIGLRTSCTGAIRVWMACSAESFRVFKDGVDTGVTVTTPNSASRYDWVTLATGDGTPHTWRFVSNYNKGLFCWSFMTVGGTLDLTYTPAVRKLLITYGDSITEALTGTGNNTNQGYSALVGKTLNLAIYNRAISGTTCHHFASGGAAFTTQSGETRTVDVTALSNAQAIILAYGTNDMVQIGGAETTANFQASYQAMLTTITAAFAAVPILCLAIMPRTAFSPNTIGLWNAAMQAAITAVGAANAKYVDTSTWICVNVGNGVNYTDPNGDLFDGTHPNAAGYAKITTQLLPLLSGLPIPIVMNSYRRRRAA